jgi:hypothetical protein
MNHADLALMRASLWLLFAALAAISLFSWLLTVASAFQVSRESNAAGLSLQVALFLICPVAMFVALRKSAGSSRGTLATFAVAWLAAGGGCCSSACYK